MRAIARRLDLSRVTVTRALAAVDPPKYSRPLRASGFDAVEGEVRRLLQRTPSIPATVIAERIGWGGSPSWFRKKIAVLRPEYAPKDPADRISYQPGDQAQCDLWFPAVPIPLGDGRSGVLPVLVMVASFSRTITAMMVPSRTTPDLLCGMWSLLSDQLGAVPRRLIWDNEAGIGRRNHLADTVPAFCGALATRIVQLKPFDPESKGIVERANQYFETSFLPGRSFSSVDDFNEQLAGWLPVANRRMVRAIRARPTELVEVDRAAMLPLPAIAPIIGFQARILLGRDYYVRVHGNDYSVDPSGIGRMVDIRADLHQVTVRLDGVLLATHRRVTGSGTTVTDPAHVATARTLRTGFQTPRPAEPDDGLLRDLAEYDTAFGVTFDSGEDVA